MNTDRLTQLWTRLTDALDYHEKKWYIKNEGAWEELSLSRLHDALLDLGIGREPQFEPIKENGVIVGSKIIPDPERAEVIQQFMYRDKEAHARPYADVRRAQLRFKL